MSCRDVAARHSWEPPLQVIGTWWHGIIGNLVWESWGRGRIMGHHSERCLLVAEMTWHGMVGSLVCESLGCCSAVSLGAWSASHVDVVELYGIVWRIVHGS